MSTMLHLEHLRCCTKLPFISSGSVYDDHLCQQSLSNDGKQCRAAINTTTRNTNKNNNTSVTNVFSCVWFVDSV